MASGIQRQVLKKRVLSCLSADLDCVFIISLLRVEQKVINSELLI